MKISIIGPGATGCLFAARFHRAGLTPTLIDNRTDRIRRLERSGITLETKSGTISVSPAFALRVPAKQDLVLVCTKAHATASVNLPPNVPVLTLQTGPSNIETLCGIAKPQNLLAGATYESVVSLGEGSVRHVAAGKTRFGGWTTCPTQPVESALSAAGFDFEVTDAPGGAIWERTAICAGIDPLTALLRIPNGRLLELKEARQLLRDLVVEAAKVAAVEGYRFETSLVERAEQVCLAATDAQSPMTQDVEAGRRTEIDSISGEIMRRAERAGLPTPRTRVIWQLVTSLQNR